MSAKCCHVPAGAPHDSDRYRRVLWIALAINAAMFVAETAAGFAAHSVSLRADALDFLADAGNYAITLFVAGHSLRHRSAAAAIKGATMGLFGIWVLVAAIANMATGKVPEASTMGVLGFLALAANALTFALLNAYRSADSNMRSAWLCTRNDFLGNCAVLLAALGVLGTGTNWPDLIVATLMGTLALQAAVTVLRQARAERAHA